jgi:RHS repeat-associated protein
MGAVTATFQYDAFGAVRASTGTATTAFGFTGQQADAGSGLTYLRARYYDPSTGRFLTKDPLRGNAAAPPTQHRYLYAGADPVNVVDPSGLSGEGPWTWARDRLINCADQNNWLVRAICRQGRAQVAPGVTVQLSDGDFTGAEAAHGISNEFSASGGSHGGGANPLLPSPASLAEKVSTKTGGNLEQLKRGYMITVPFRRARSIIIRVMEEGGGRTNYYRISVEGKQAYTVTGEASVDRALTHIDIAESSLDDILRIVESIRSTG